MKVYDVPVVNDNVCNHVAKKSSRIYTLGGCRYSPEDTGCSSLLVCCHEGNGAIEPEWGILQVLKNIQIEHSVWL